MTLYDFLSEHWLVAIVLALIGCGTIKFVVDAPLRFYRTRMRAQNIAKHGWPTPPMDADGDVVYPDECECEDRTPTL